MSPPDETPKLDQAPASLSDDDLSVFKEMGVDLDRLNAEVAKLSTEKVELDTYGLDLDSLGPPERPKPGPAEPTLDLAQEPAKAEEIPGPEKRPRWLYLAAAGAGVVVLALGGVVVYLKVLKPPPPKPVAEIVQTTVSGAMPRPDPKASQLELTDFMVPFKGAKGTMLRVSLNLSVELPQLKLEILSRITAVRDAVYRALLDNGNIQVPLTAAQKSSLQQALKEAINRVLTSRPVKEVLFTNFYVI